MAQPDVAREVADRLDTGAVHEVLIGFDGFVDAIIHLVDERRDEDTFTTIERMEGFADRIQQAAGLSCNVELVVAQTRAVS